MDKMFLEGMGFPAIDGWLTVLSSFRTKGLGTRPMAGWSFVADVFKRWFSTTIAATVADKPRR
jgi:hypothetical protein